MPGGVYVKMQCVKVPLCELCKIERAIKGKKYSAGSCYIKLSAVDETVNQLKKSGAIDSRYAVLEPIKKINTDYFYIAVNKKFPEFLQKYRTTINLQIDTLKNFVLDWHEDEKTQKHIVKAVNTVDKEISCIEAQIEQEKEIKRWYLAKMLM